MDTRKQWFHDTARPWIFAKDCAIDYDKCQGFVYKEDFNRDGSPNGYVFTAIIGKYRERLADGLTKSEAETLLLRLTADAIAFPVDIAEFLKSIRNA